MEYPSWSLATHPDSENILHLPREVRNYIPEVGGGRGFNLDSFTVGVNPQRQAVLQFFITHAGAEQLQPLSATSTITEDAARQLADALNKALAGR